jgi:peptide deformylase
MSIRPIIKLPDPRLRLVSEPVETVDDDVRALLDDMAETMYDAPGIGLAAIQIAEPVRLVVIDVSRDEENRQPVHFVNPEIVWTSEEMGAYEEGCLSIPEVYEKVERPAECKVAYLDRDGAPQEMHCDGLLATCIQHEMDHLDGVIFVDHLSALKRKMILRKLAKQKKLQAQAAD